MHAHTTASDGRATPEELIALAKAADLQAVAITDHDTLDGLAAAQIAADGAGLQLVHGIELSTIDGAREVHLLGLHLQRTEALADRLVSVQSARVDRAVEMVAKLDKLGMPVTMDMVLHEAAGGAVGRPHVARALIAGGWVHSMREAFDRYLGDGKPANVGKLRLDLSDGIALIHDAGGVAIWAHPQGEGSKDKIGRYAALGLDGVEVRHPSHNSEDLARLATLAEHFGLLKSGGSDWHGALDRIPTPRVHACTCAMDGCADRARAGVARADRIALERRVVMSLAGQTALVTGGARRVGRAIALALAGRGADLVIHYHSGAVEAEETAAAARAMGVRVALVHGDLSRSTTAEALPQRAHDAMGRLDIVVNSAAMMLRTPIGDVTTDAWDTMFALNLRAPFFIAQAAAPLMQRDGGAIVNIADLAAFETWPAYVPHAITKAGVVQMTRGLARALAPTIRVNAVAPGAVLLPEEWGTESAERLAHTTPLKRLGSADDVAQAVVYLCEASYVTGEVIVVDGGRHIRT
ncbi:MAG: SDR family oxidoreductase [Gemmatimonadaceae bacterium]|nr:SDR family oxidoreductase [Gemmatimonadaceae bacterium]